MCHLFLSGDWSNDGQVLMILHQHGYNLMWVPCTQCMAQNNQVGRVLSLVTISNETDLLPLTATQEQQCLPWIAWMRLELPHLTSQIYQAGALAVLPPNSSAETLVQAVGNACAILGYNQKEPSPRMRTRERHYQRGDTIMVEMSDVIDIRRGVVTVSVIYQDGTEVLLGFYGAGHMLVGHPEDSCCTIFRAHTDTLVRIYPWCEVVKDPGFSERLRFYSEQTTTWSALRSHPYLEQRILGILHFLAEQFGKPHSHGILIDIRVTHAQLASASSATRGTITRIMKELRQRNQIVSVTYRNEERFCLCSCEDSCEDCRAVLKQKQTIS